MKIITHQGGITYLAPAQGNHEAERPQGSATLHPHIVHLRVKHNLDPEKWHQWQPIKVLCWLPVQFSHQSIGLCLIAHIWNMCSNQQSTFTVAEMTLQAIFDAHDPSTSLVYPFSNANWTYTEHHLLVNMLSNNSLNPLQNLKLFTRSNLSAYFLKSN